MKDDDDESKILETNLNSLIVDANNVKQIPKRIQKVFLCWQPDESSNQKCLHSINSQPIKTLWIKKKSWKILPTMAMLIEVANVKKDEGISNSECPVLWLPSKLGQHQLICQLYFVLSLNSIKLLIVVKRFLLKFP